MVDGRVFGGVHCHAGHTGMLAVGHVERTVLVGNKIKIKR